MKRSAIEELLPWYVNGTLEPLERAQVDAALEVDPSMQADLTALADLAREVRSTHDHAHVPPASVRADVFARIAAPPRRALWTLQRVRPVVAACAAVFVIAAIAFIARTARHDESRIVSGSVSDSYAVSSGVGPVASVSTAKLKQGVNAAPARKAAASLAHDAQIAREGNVSVLVDDVERSIGSAQSYARGHDAVVVSLEDDVPSDPRGRHIAKIAVRVPAAQFDDAMDTLARLGALQGRSVSAEDLGRQIVDGAARLRNLRRTESDLLRIMDRSGRVADILEVQNQVSATRESIEQLDSELQNMRERVAYATVVLTLASNAHNASAEPSMGAQLGDAWANALRGGRAFTLALVALVLEGVVFMPYAVLGAGALYLAWRRLRR